MDDWMIWLLAFLGLIFLVGLIFFLKFFNLWIQAYMSRTPVSLISLVGMQFRKVNPSIIVRSMISGTQAKIDPPLNTRELEAHYLAGGRVLNFDGDPLRYNKENLLNPYFIVLGERSVPWREAWAGAQSESDRSPSTGE